MKKKKSFKAVHGIIKTDRWNDVKKPCWKEIKRDG